MPLRHYFAITLTPPLNYAIASAADAAAASATMTPRQPARCLPPSSPFFHCHMYFITPLRRIRCI
jgi:hypothetical protein